MASPTITAIVITKNEADTIARCLKSLTFADEKIVIDSGSTDSTIALAKQHGAHVIEHPWKGYGSQKNIGLAAAHGTWTLFVDADEEITPQLASEIKKTLKNPTKDFYWLRILTIFLGKPLTHLYGHNPRLFKKEAGQWTEDPVHEQVVTNNGIQIRLNDNRSAVLQRSLLHYSHDTIHSYLTKMHRYTTLDAQRMAQSDHHRSGKKVSPQPILPYKLAAKQLLKLLFYKHGILDGTAGITWSALSAYYEYEMGKKYLQLKEKKRVTV